MCQPNLISQEAVNAVTESAVYANNAVWTPSKYLLANVSTSAGSNLDGDIEHFCAPVIHPETGETITSYKKLARDPLLKETWTNSLGREFGSLAQGDIKSGTKGTNCVFVMNHEQIASIPADRVVTYARIVVDYRPQKKHKERVPVTRTPSNTRNKD